MSENGNKTGQVTAAATTILEHKKDCKGSVCYEFKGAPSAAALTTVYLNRKFASINNRPDSQMPRKIKVTVEEVLD